jgi:hypothetical protein
VSFDVRDVCVSGGLAVHLHFFANWLLASQEAPLSLVRFVLKQLIQTKPSHKHQKKLQPKLTAAPGNVGIITGPPFFAAMAEYMNGTNQLAIQGVDYPADIAGFLAGGSPTGVVVMCVLIPHSLIFQHSDNPQGQTNKPHPRRLPQHAPPPFGLLARRTTRAPSCCHPSRQHDSQDLLCGPVWGSEERDGDSGDIVGQSVDDLPYWYVAVH